MDVKVFTYIFLVYVTLKLQKTSAQCTITLSGSARLTVYNCCRNKNAGPPGPEGLEGEFAPRAFESEGHAQLNNLTSAESIDEFGTMDWPAGTLCKFALPELKSGTYYVGPIGKPIKVYCNMETRETCITKIKTTPEFDHDPSKGAFWLLEENVQLKDLYEDISYFQKCISVEQLTWLRDRAETVRQTLKYNCLDSVPYSKYNMSSSVQLLAWNNVVIGPHTTDESPLFYTIPEATDKCVEDNTEWKSTIIELQSSNVYRLPIVDMWIGDIRNENQKVTIESVELCFG